MLERPSLDDFAAMADRLELPPDFAATASGGFVLEARGRLRVQRGEHESGLADLRACEQVYAALGWASARRSRSGGRRWRWPSLPMNATTPYRWWQKSLPSRPRPA